MAGADAESLPGLDATLGIVFDEASAERVAGRLPVTAALLQPAGLVHGGVYAALAESAASLGTFRAVGDGGEVPLGMSNSTSFLRPVASGTIAVTARPRHRGRTTWVWDVEMTDEDGALCAVSRVTVAVRPRGA